MRNDFSHPGGYLTSLSLCPRLQYLTSRQFFFPYFHFYFLGRPKSNAVSSIPAYIKPSNNSTALRAPDPDAETLATMPFCSNIPYNSDEKLVKPPNGVKLSDENAYLASILLESIEVFSKLQLLFPHL